MQEDKKKLVSAFVLSAAVCFMFFMYAPLEMYFANKDELFIVFLCSYVQGNYLVKYLPVMDGRAIDWSLYSNGRLQSVILWIVVISVFLLLHFKPGAERVCGLIRVVSICMILMFGVTLVTLCISNHGLEKKEYLCICKDCQSGGISRGG